MVALFILILLSKFIKVSSDCLNIFVNSICLKFTSLYIFELKKNLQDYINKNKIKKIELIGYQTNILNLIPHYHIKYNENTTKM